MQELYNTNPDFAIYVDTYARRKGITPEEALTHALIIGAAEDFKTKEPSAGDDGTVRIELRGINC